MCLTLILAACSGNAFVTSGGTCAAASTCPIGSYASAQPTPNTDRQCSLCAAGSYQSSAGYTASACTSCTAGSNFQVPLLSGSLRTFFVGLSLVNTSLISTADIIQNEQGASGCKNCVPGFVAIGVTAQQPCSPGAACVGCASSSCNSGTYQVSRQGTLSTYTSHSRTSHTYRANSRSMYRLANPIRLRVDAVHACPALPIATRTRWARFYAKPVIPVLFPSTVAPACQHASQATSVSIVHHSLALQAPFSPAGASLPAWRARQPSTRTGLAPLHASPSAVGSISCRPQPKPRVLWEQPALRGSSSRAPAAPSRASRAAPPAVPGACATQASIRLRLARARLIAPARPARRARLTRLPTHCLHARLPLSAASASTRRARPPPPWTRPAPAARLELIRTR